MSWLNQNDSTVYAGKQDAPDPDWYEGGATAIPRGVAGAGLRFLEMTGALTLALEESLGNTEEAEIQFQRVERRRKARESLGQGRQGFASRLLFGVSETALLVMFSPSFGSVSYGTSEASSELARGKTLTEAESLGAIRGTAAFLGAKIPAALAPKYGLLPTLGYGAAASAGVGMAQRAIEMPFLPDNEEQAILDPESVATDATLGALFGVWAHRAEVGASKQAKDMSPPSAEVVDASLDARAIKKAQDAAPAVPQSMQDMNAHLDAMSETISAIEEGRSPVYTSIQERIAAMPEDPQVAERISAIDRSASEILPDAEIVRAPEGAEYGMKLRFDDYVGHDLDSIQWMKDNGLLSGEEAAKLSPKIEAPQNAPVRPELPTVQDLRTVSGGVPRETWAESTRVTGTDGKPAVIYRGSQDGTTSAEAFNESALGKATGHPSASLGVWFSASKADASTYGKVGEYHLDLRNPRRYTIENLPDFETPEQFAALRRELKAKGHDGVMIDMRDVGGPVQFVAFDAESVINFKGEQAKPKAGKTEKAPAKLSLSDSLRLGETVDVGGLKIHPDLKVDGEITAKELVESVAKERADFEESLPQIEDLMQCIIGASGA